MIQWNDPNNSEIIFRYDVDSDGYVTDSSAVETKQGTIKYIVTPSADPDSEPPYTVKYENFFDSYFRLFGLHYDSSMKVRTYREFGFYT